MKVKILAAAAAAMMLGACAATGAVSLFKDFKVNGQTVTSAYQTGIYDDLIAGGQKDSQELRNLVKAVAVERTALLQEAAKQGIDKDPRVLRQIEAARVQILANQLSAAYLKDNPVSEAEILAAYNQAKAQYGENEYHVRQIFIKDEARAREVLDQLNKKPARFEALAKTGDDKVLAANSGDMGWIAVNTFKDKRIGDLIARTQPGKHIGEAVKSAQGYHILRVDEVRKAQNFPTLEQTRQSIAQQLANMKAAQYRAGIVKKAVVAE